MSKIVKERWEKFKDGFWRGFGWSFGVTVGFVVVSSLGVILLRIAGWLPLTGSIVADVVQETQLQLEKRSVISPR